MKAIISLQLLILTSILFVGTFCGYYSPPVNNLCPDENLYAKINATDAAADIQSKWVVSCIPKSALIADCYVYDNVNGGCFCNAQDSYKPRRIEQPQQSDPFLGCVPPSQDRFNGKCTRLSNLSYNCVCDTSQISYYPYEIKMSADDADNPIKVPKACVNQFQKVENCQEYELVSNIQLPMASFSYDGERFKIKCKICTGGFRGFSTDHPTGYIDYLSDQTIGCPKDQTYERSSCNVMTYDPDNPLDDSPFDYVGYKCRCTGPEFWTRFLTASNFPIAQACVPMMNFKYLDEGCLLYSYSTSPEKIVCAKCIFPQLNLITFTGDQEGQVFKSCTPSEQKTGCSGYYAPSIQFSFGPLACYKCKDDYDYIQSQTGVTINGVTGKTTGFCAPRSRWLVEYNYCSTYIEPISLQGVVQDLYLACRGPCVTQSSVPCYAGSSKATQYDGYCPSGQLSVLAGDSKENACISIGIIQNCKTYSDLTPGGFLSPNIASGKCTECEDGFELVDTQLSKPDGGEADDTKKICLPKSFKDPNCEVYSNNDFSCFKCNNTFTYNLQAKRCGVITDASAACLKAIPVGDKVVCVTCKKGFTSIGGGCVPSVTYCASLSISGICSSCVSGFQLVNNQCIQKALNCERVDEKGGCVQCKSGLTPNPEGKCVSSSSSGQNLCPAGQVLQNGACVPVRISIDGCLQYTIESMCEQCVQGKRPSEDKLKCVDASEKPGAKPCPPNTNTVIYKRNPSNPLGDCVAVDALCILARDDGFCINCKDGAYAHTDGKCYKLQLTNIEGN